MKDQLSKILSESANLPENVQEQINEAWEARLSEAKTELNAVLREEFARKYEHDKKVLSEAMDKFLTDKVRVELEEFAEDKRLVAEERVAYKKKMREHAQLLDKFILENLAKEVKELHEDKRKMNESFSTLEDFLMTQLAEEIQEFRDDKNILREQRVKMIREGKKHLAETSNKFVKRAATLVEKKVDVMVRSEMKQFVGDIKEARENQFGREIFESFAATFMDSYLNEGTQLSKMNKQLVEANSKVAELEKARKEHQVVVEGLEDKVNASRAVLERTRVMNDLMAPLSKSNRDVMSSLLESVDTNKLEVAFNKYLPSVLNEKKTVNSGRKSLKESKRKLSTKNGNRAPNALQESTDTSDDLQAILSLAGLRQGE